MNSVQRRLALVLAGPMLLLAGCGEAAGPTTPSGRPGAPAASRAGGGPELEWLAAFRQEPAGGVAWAKRWIGPEGGRLDLGGFAVEVPAGAVDRPTQFSIRLPVDPQGAERVVAEFGPHNQVFARPVEIELPYAGTSVEGADATIVWWDPDARAWVDVGAALTADGTRLRTPTPHFSTFGVSSGGTILMSGGRELR